MGPIANLARPGIKPGTFPDNAQPIEAHYAPIPLLTAAEKPIRLVAAFVCNLCINYRNFLTVELPDCASVDTASGLTDGIVAHQSDLDFLGDCGSNYRNFLTSESHYLQSCDSGSILTDGIIAHPPDLNSLGNFGINYRNFPTSGPPGCKSGDSGANLTGGIIANPSDFNFFRKFRYLLPKFLDT